MRLCKAKTWFSMKKTTKYIIIALAVVVLLVGALLVLNFTDPKKAESSESESSATSTDVSLITKDENTLKSIHVKNEFSDFTVNAVQVENEVESTASSEASSEGESSAPEKTITTNYSIEGFENYEVKTDTLKSAAKIIFSLSYVMEIGQVEAEKLGDYGLGDTAADVTAEFTDGTKESLKIGSPAGETTGNYILYNDKVYISPMNTMFTTDVINQVTPASWAIDEMADESGNAFSFLNYIKVTGEKYPRTVEVVYDEVGADYEMKQPMIASGNISYTETLITALRTFATTSTVKVNAKEEDLKEYGLDVPYAQVEFTINGKSHKITAGAKNGASRYVYIDNYTDAIYLADAAKMEPWTDAGEVKFRDSFVRLTMITTVNKLTVEAAGSTTVVDFARTPNEEKSTDTQTVYDYTTKKNGVDIEYPEVTSFYGDLISIAVLNMNEMQHVDKADVTITYSYYSGEPEDKVEFFKGTEGDDRYVAYVNGVYAATVRGTSIEAFLKSYEKFSAK